MVRKSTRLERLYQSRRWRNLSVQHREQHPLCVECQRECDAEGQGRINISLAVLCHHVGMFDEKRQSDVEFWLMPIEGLCHRHHELHHNRNPARERPTFDPVTGWPTDPTFNPAKRRILK